MDIQGNTGELSRNRLSVVEYIHHQQPGQQPKSVERRWCRDVASDERTYERTLLVTEQWKELDTGWLEGVVGHLHLSNDEGRLQTQVPSEEYKETLARKVVEVGVLAGHSEDTSEPFVVAFGEVRPKETCRLTPCADARLYLRCRHGKAKVTLTLTPE